MIIAHFADLHLGYRAYSRVTAAGMNQREADVGAAFARAVDAVVRLQPDLLVVAGDVFHSVRPSNSTIAETFRRFAALRSALPAMPIVMVAGDRDTPRSADSVSILELFREIPGVHVATQRVEVFHLAQIDAEVLAVPHAALSTRPPSALHPVTDAGMRVLLAHAGFEGEAAGRLDTPGVPEGGALLAEGSVDPGEWHYVALGHHPVTTEIAPNFWYAGSIERTSSWIWAEAGVPKGFLTFDTQRTSAHFHEVPTREVVDLPRISARGRSPTEIDSSIAAVIDGAGDGLTGRIVRLVITDINRVDLRHLDQEQLRRLRAATLHFLLEARPPPREVAGLVPIPMRGATLEQQLEEYLGRVWTPTMDGIDREVLAGLGRSYLREAAEGSEP